MSVRLYFDVHVRRAITVALRIRGVDVLTAQEDVADRFDDASLLNRAGVLGRVLFSHDDDLLREATRRQSTGEAFAGVIDAHQLNVTIGQCIDDLELIAKVSDPEEWTSRLTYLPLK